tara:strand:+ start:9437 stop:10471 length:1035 start_codon:yes stop_codon:yes gene_type:complete
MGEHPVYLHKGAWLQFKIFLALHLKGYAKRWDSHLSQKIFMILQREELRERYLSGFPPLLPSEKLDLALDDIIDPLETLEELSGPVPHEKSGWRQAHMENYHPGRLTLNPDAYHHAYTESMGIGKGHVCKVLEMGWTNLHGGSYCEGYRCPPREGDPYPGKHRLLDRPEYWTKDPSKVASRAWAGLQDTYFLGGLPLIFWERSGRFSSMGMRVATEEFCQPFDPSNYLTVHIADFQRGRVAGFQWRSSKELQEYERMWYLPTEGEYWPLESGELRLGGPSDRIPRTYRSGSQPWIDKQAGENHGSNDAYINHIQRIEDVDVAVADYLRPREKVQPKTLGDWSSS